MGVHDRARSGTALCWPSRILKRGLSTVAGKAIARLDAHHHDLWLGDRGATDARLWPATRCKAERIEAEPGPLVSVEVLGRHSERPAWTGLAADPGPWSVFEIGFASGVIDQLALRLDGRADAHVPDVIRALWPILRDGCLRELAGARRPEADALLWMVSQRMGAAILVLDGRGCVVQANAAGAAMLAQGRPLRERPDGLAASTPGESRALRRAIAECLTRPGPNAEVILVLEDADGPGRLPLSLSRFDGAGAGGGVAGGGVGEPLVVLLAPRPPDPRRIQMLAQRMGLTPAEARVATLMQLGRPNREAACIAGLKEQTFNTYAKRVLAKLNVGSRAEVAQMLTWQAGLGMMA